MKNLVLFLSFYLAVSGASAAVCVSPEFDAKIQKINNMVRGKKIRGYQYAKNNFDEIGEIKLSDFTWPKEDFFICYKENGKPNKFGTKVTTGIYQGEKRTGKEIIEQRGSDLVLISYYRIENEDPNTPFHENRGNIIELNDHPLFRLIPINQDTNYRFAFRDLYWDVITTDDGKERLIGVKDFINQPREDLFEVVEPKL